MKKRIVGCGVLLSIYLISLGSLPSVAQVNPILDHSIYAELLKKYVKNGKVDYAGFKAEETKLDAYLAILQALDSDSLSRVPLVIAIRPERVNWSTLNLFIASNRAWVSSLWPVFSITVYSCVTSSIRALCCLTRLSISELDVRASVGTLYKAIS